MPPATPPSDSHVQSPEVDDNMGERDDTDGNADQSPADVINGLTRELPDDDIQMPTLDRDEDIMGDMDDDFESAEPEADVYGDEPWTDGESDVDS